MGGCSACGARRRRGRRDVTSILPPTTTIRPVPSPVGHTRLPRYVFGPKPRRRTELGLLALRLGAWSSRSTSLPNWAQKSKVPADLGPFLGIVLALALAAHMTNRWLVPFANPVILPLAALLNGIGYVIIARWNPPYARSQAGLDRARPRPLHLDALGRPLFPGSGALPLPPVARGGPPVGLAAVLQPHQRSPAVGARRAASNSSPSSSQRSCCASSLPRTSRRTRNCCPFPQPRSATACFSTRARLSPFWWRGVPPWS